jgi:Concanavalin A-like lectin/glucanases superfamily
LCRPLSLVRTAGTSTGTLPNGLVVAMKDDFSIGYWLNTTMTAPTNSNLYSGAALIDAEVCGATSDWGTALINGGAVAFGIGNPDITIISPATGYNDGNWHFVTATRAEAAGTIILYVDGVQVATTTGTATTARSAPTILGLGRNNCVATGVFTGSLDDVIAYARVLSPTEVSNLYNFYSAIALPLDWVSFSGRADAGQVQLQWEVGDVVGNDHFEVDRSSDGSHFNQIGVVAEGENTVTDPGVQTFRYTDADPVSGSNFYRIKQVDVNGRYTYSTVVDVTAGSGAPGFRLQSNPVRGVVTLLNPGQERVDVVQVVDVAGRVLIDYALSSTNTVFTENVEWLQAGYYFLRVASRGKTVSVPFVKW